MKADRRLLAWTLLALIAANRAVLADGKNLVKNPDLEQAADPARPDHFELIGDAARAYVGATYEISSMGAALDSGRDRDGDHKREGAVTQDVPITEALPGRWFRFKIRGLPEDGFAVAHDQLQMKVDFFGDHGKRALDGVTHKIYPLVEQERRDLTANGVRHKGGAAAWKTYAFEFRLPFPDVDQVRLSVGFREGKGTGKNTSFFVDEIALTAIPAPTDALTPIRSAQPSAVDPSKLVALGGRWFYLPEAGEKMAKGGSGLVVTARNADRLFYHDGDARYLNPFAENMSAWLKKGYLDLEGNLVDKDELKPDNVTITFDATSLIVHAHNLPNHPTSKFPSVPGSGDRNPNYIQEQDSTFQLPLKPEHNPAARAMDLHNTNRALPMGPTGIAVNGVVFFNPFDAGMTDATDLMDRCCGHPNPENQYHYHKYPVCVKSPFADEGKEHSPLIGWAFDGYAIYGPYESAGVMAKDSKERPLSAFNGHEDPERGWHYHVTPGKFPYILGGYWGKLDPRARRGPGMMAGPGPGGPGPGGPGFGPPGGGSPLMRALDVDRDRVLSSSEIKNAATVLKRLDRNDDGALTPDELRPPGPPREED
jgi:YHYH protein